MDAKANTLYSPSHPIHIQMLAALTMDASGKRLLATPGMKMMYFGTGKDTSKKKTCNSKFKPHDGEADKPGNSLLDLESSRELVWRLKEEDWIASTIEKKIAFAENHFETPQKHDCATNQMKDFRKKPY